MFTEKSLIQFTNAGKGYVKTSARSILSMMKRNISMSTFVEINQIYLCRLMTSGRLATKLYSDK